MTLADQTFDAAYAESVLREACAIAQLDTPRIDLVRLGDHAVFRLDGGVLISRVGRGADRIPSVEREVSVARWLAAESYPAARLATAARQPVVVGGCPVTFWEGVGDGETYASTREMGALLRQLHELPTPPFHLPELRPFDKVTARLERAAIPRRTRVYLSALATELEDAYRRLTFALPAGAVHGDFNVGNVLRDAEGHAKVIDLDGFATGPREWDLMQTAMYFDSFGWHTEDEYASFAASYGFDVREWDGYATLRSVRELLMVTWLSQNAASDPRSAAEVEKRVATMRSGGSRREWAPF
jgi:aminoglycoside phosphotransferase (APT) family kinase protein